MSTCKREAQRWVHRYAAGGSAFTLVPLPITSASLTTLEMHMFAVIGSIYGETVSNVHIAAAGNLFSVVGMGLKWLALRGTLLLPRWGAVLRMALAAATVESIGYAFVRHFESKYPGKELPAGVPRIDTASPTRT